MGGVDVDSSGTVVRSSLGAGETSGGKWQVLANITCAFKCLWNIQSWKTGREKASSQMLPWSGKVRMTPSKEQCTQEKQRKSRLPLITYTVTLLTVSKFTKF